MLPVMEAFCIDVYDGMLCSDVCYDGMLYSDACYDGRLCIIGCVYVCVELCIHTHWYNNLFYCFRFDIMEFRRHCWKACLISHGLFR